MRQSPRGQPRDRVYDRAACADGDEVNGHSKRAFFVGPIAISVFRCRVRGNGHDEVGCRVEMQRLHQRVWPDRRVPTVYVLDEPLWRADFLTLDGSEPGSLNRAHYHPHFEGRTPCKRAYDPSLTADPTRWLERQLDDMPLLLRAAGADDIAHLADQHEVDAMTPSICQAVLELLP